MIVRHARLLRSARWVAMRLHLQLLAAALIVAGGLAIASAPLGAHAPAPARSQLVETCSGAPAPC
ncbi:MAG TPA: hypothetical protein VF808_10470 [Ktedonobacterales bacterium]